MGDPTFATLHLAGTITSAATLEALHGLLKKHRADPRAHMNTLPAPGPLLPSYTFEQINYGRLYDDIEAAILSFGLSYIWEHDRGHDYPACMQVWYEGMLHHEQLSHAKEPYLEYSERDDRDRRTAIADFITARDAVFSLPFLFAPSAHALMAIHTHKDRP